MTIINNLMRELDEGTIARQIGSKHDNARVQYQLRTNTVENYRSFIEVITDYYSYHFQYIYQCGPLPPADAEGKAKALVNQAYRQHRGDIMTAFKEARDNINGGTRRVLDVMCDAMKGEHIEQYIENVFDRYADPDDFDSMAEILRQFCIKYGDHFRSVLQIDKPAFYARDWKRICRIMVDTISQAASAYRRI